MAQLAEAASKCLHTMRPTAAGSRCLVREPAPEVTLTTRGMLRDFFRRGAKASTIRRGPVVLVAKACDMFCPGVPVVLTPAMAALLTRPSSLVGWVSDVQEEAAWMERQGHMRVDAYLPYLLSTSFAATEIDSSLATSTCNSSTVPSRFRDWRSSITALPFLAERLPMRTWLDGSASSCEACSKPMPPLAVDSDQFVLVLR